MAPKKDKAEQRRLYQAKRMTDYVKKLTMARRDVYFELKSAGYDEMDVTWEACVARSQKFQQWEMFHKLQVSIMAATMQERREDVVREFCEIGMTQAILQEEELKRTNTNDNWVDEVVRNLTVTFKLQKGCSAFSNLTIEEKGGVLECVFRENESFQKRWDSLFELANHPQITDSTDRLVWRTGLKYPVAVRCTAGLVYVNADTEEELFTDTGLERDVTSTLKGRIHSRYCDIKGENLGGLVLHLLMESDKELKEHVQALADLQVCDCLERFRTGERYSINIAVTLMTGSVPPKKRSPRWRDAFSWPTNLWTQRTWWLRLYANYFRMEQASGWIEDPDTPRLQVKASYPYMYRTEEMEEPTLKAYLEAKALPH